MTIAQSSSVVPALSIAWNNTLDRLAAELK